MIVLSIYFIGFIITIFWWGIHQVKNEQDITIVKIIQHILLFLVAWTLAPVIEIIETIRLNYGTRMYNFFTKPRFKVTK